MRALVLGLVASFLLTMSACGGDPKPTHQAGQPERPTATGSPNVEESPPETPAPSREASCDLVGTNPAHVTMIENSDNVTVTWDGQGIAPVDTTGFFVEVWDGQMGVRFIDGRQIAYFIAIDILNGRGQSNLPGEALVNDKKVRAVFPKDVGGLGGIKIAKWNAAYTLAGRDAGLCPDSDA